MKKQSALINLLIISAVLFGMAFKCGSRGGSNTRVVTRNNNRTTNNTRGTDAVNDDDEEADTPAAPKTSTNNTGGFEDGHLLKGRYSNADQGIRSFTFYTDGRFERGGASSGSYRGGEYSSGSTNSGTYYLSGNTLSLTNENGDSAGELSIEIINATDYSAESPVRLRIDGVTYTNVN
ncbi:MAG TPA: hypothetical protein VGC97_05555 [Pyrinomonadaceae bacterium]|jgi:hypothetical protein